MRAGHYTTRWLGNLILSPMVYVAAGLMWNLEAFGYVGCRLAFFRDDWPQPAEDKSFKPVVIASIPFGKLAVLDAATKLEDLSAVPGNHLEKLSGDRKGQHSIRINDQYRICFEWTDGGPINAEIVDYH